MPAPPLTPLAAAVLEVDAPERILQVQCGDGEGAFFLAREFPAARVRGVDSSERRIRAATARIGLDPEGRIAFKVGGPRSLPYPDGLFDLVAVVDEPIVVRELARVLRPGGFLLDICTESGRAPRGLRASLLRRRLSGRGLATVATGTAGAGGYSVWRLRDPADTDASD